MMKASCEFESEYFMQQMVHQKLRGSNLPHPKCKSTLLVELVTELTQIREELVVCMSKFIKTLVFLQELKMFKVL